MSSNLPRIGPVLDLRELNEGELREIKDVCAQLAASSDETRPTRILYAALLRAVRDEISYRVLTADQPLDIPDGLD